MKAINTQNLSLPNYVTMCYYLYTLEIIYTYYICINSL